MNGVVTHNLRLQRQRMTLSQDTQSIVLTIWAKLLAIKRMHSNTNTLHSVQLIENNSYPSTYKIIIKKISYLK